MKFDFDQVIDRRNTQSSKWDAVEGRFGRKDILPMWVADMDFKTAPPIIEDLEKRVQHGIFGYAFRPDEYFEAVIGWMKEQHGWKVERDWMTNSPGVVTAMNLCVLAFTNPGDKVLVQPPVYYPFFKAIENHGRRIANNPLIFKDGRYYMDFDDLEKNLDDSTRMMILSSPHNPVGRAWTREELKTLGEFCARNDIVLLSDEVHSDLIFPGSKHVPTAAISEEISMSTVTCIAPSKTFNLAGLKASSIIIQSPVLREKYIEVLSGLSLTGENTFGLTAIISAYTKGRPWLEELLKYLEANLEFTIKYFEEKIPKIKVIRPDATYLIWLDCRELALDDETLDDLMMNKAKVGLDEGHIFGQGGSGFQRINIACPRATLTEGLRRIENAVNEL